MFDVITFGSLTRDVFLRSREMELHTEHGVMEACFVFGAKLNVDEIALETGGGAGNNATTFARMGKFKTAAVARLGADAPGDDIIKALKNDRIDTRYIRRETNERTAYSTILLSGVAERTILTFRGASAHMGDVKKDLDKMSARLFYLSSLAGDLDLLAAIITRAKKIKALVFMNPGGKEFKQPKTKLLPLLKQLDLVIVNREEAAALTGAPLHDLKKLVTAMRAVNEHTIITDGRAGAYAITPEDVIHAAIIPCERTNLTGAGDAFGSAYAVGMLKHKNIRTALALGTLNATSVVQHTGAKVGILHHLPTTKEIEKVKIKKIIL